MTRNKTRWFSLLALPAILLALLLAPAGVLAQGETLRLELLTVRVWPEFDRPSALVFLIGEVDAATVFPVDITIDLPAGAQVNAVAYLDPDTNSLLMAQSQQEGSTLTITLEAPTFWVEFYDPALTIEGDRRSYAFNWTTPYAVDVILWEVQTPYNAQDMVIEPSEGGEMDTDQMGLPSMTIIEGGMAAGATLSLEFTYTKPDSILSADAMGVRPTDAGTTTTLEPAADTGGTSPLVIVLLVVAGVGLIGGGVYWYLHSTGLLERRGAGVRQPISGEKRFCTQCGKPVGGEDLFCRHCGAKLKG